MTVEVREATNDDARWIGPRLREVDQAESELVHQKGSPADNVMASLRVSWRSGVLIVDGEIVAIGGVGWGRDRSSCCPWFMGTDAIAKHPVTVLRYSRFFIEHLKKEFKLMENWLLRENVEARGLVEVLGFTFDGYDAVYKDGVMDHFIWRAS